MKGSAAGRAGEEAAARFFEAAGKRVVARNYRAGRGEVDLVVLDGETIAFVEVKAWNAFGAMDLELSVNAAKQRRIIETAKIFLCLHRQYKGMAVRFDVVFLDGSDLRYLASAFTERV